MNSKLIDAFSAFSTPPGATKTLLAHFLNNAKTTRNGLPYNVQFTHDSCVITFPPHCISLRIMVYDWGTFMQKSRSNSVVYRIDLIENQERLRVSSKYLGYDIHDSFNTKTFTNFSLIEAEIMRVYNLLKSSLNNPSIKIINSIDERWGYTSDAEPINCTQTITRELYQSGLTAAKTLVKNIEEHVDEMTEQRKAATISLNQLNAKNYEKAYNDFLSKQAEKENISVKPDDQTAAKTPTISSKTPSATPKKLKPILGEDSRKPAKISNEQRQFTQPPTIHPTFFNISIVQDKDKNQEYLLLLKMENKHSCTHNIFYLGFRNTPFNMVHTAKTFGVEIVFLDQNMEVDQSYLNHVHNHMITSVDEFETVFLSLEKKFH
uniref:Uncharacterized protein n=1 Tax=viral metagenome TaxID=1070528 RepID=A0A6C0EB43_9ZZZZ